MRSQKLLFGCINFSTLNPFSAGLLFTAIEFGSGLLTLPGVVSELGTVAFVFTLFFFAALTLYCTLLGNYALDVVINASHNDEKLVRQPIQICSEMAFGKGSYVKKAITLLQTLAHQSQATVGILIAATTTQSLIPLPIDISFNNKIRIWIVVVYLVLLLPTIIGSYNEMGYIGLLSVLFIVIAVIIVLIAALGIHKYHIPVQSPEETKHLEISLAWSKYDNTSVIITTFGILFLAFNGYMLALPNIAVLMRNKALLEKTILASIVMLFFLYLIAGCIPYLLLNEYVIEGSIINTLSRITGSSEHTSFKIFIKIVEVLVVLHFLITVILAMNPVYLVTEVYFNIPQELSLRRVGLRFTLLASCTAFSLVFPMFSQFISWIGGGLLMIYCYIIPIVLYLNICRPNLWTKVFCYVLVAMIIVIFFGVNYVSLKALLL